MGARCTVHVDLPNGRDYRIFIGRGLSGEADVFASHLAGESALIVTDETVAQLRLEPLKEVLRSVSPQLKLAHLTLPCGEAHKNLDTVSMIYDRLIEAGHGRDTTLLALGGGVVGDITGYAAATYQRGVAFLQLPTTLLAMVDSSVGGKTGVNHPKGKNMIGAFHQPNCVVADLAALDSLPERELSAGFAEIVKIALIRDARFFDWLEERADSLMGRDEAALAEAVRRSCQHKAQVCAQDERERGQRALLNLGHTFGHALEVTAGYGRYLHGEAVAVGMTMAARYSVLAGLLDESAARRIARVLSRFRLPTQLEPSDCIAAEAMRGAMETDKKVLAGRLRLVVLQGIGEACLSTDISERNLQAALGG